jgi:hypothetical protein
MLRRVLSRRVSVEAMIEFVMWLAIPYLIIGFVLAFIDAEQVQAMETSLRGRMHAGSEIVSLVLTASMWPLTLIGADMCPPT